MEVSIIIPYFNHGKYLQAAVQSALMAAQGIEAEIILINDGSQEEKSAYFLTQAQRLSPCLRVLNQANQGLSGARNNGVKQARGEYIQFLDADDLLFPGKFFAHLQHFKLRKNLHISLSEYCFSDAQALRFQPPLYPLTYFKFCLEAFLFLWERPLSIPIHTALFKRSVFDHLEFDERVSGKEDWIFWCEASLNFPKGISALPHCGAAYRLHEHAMTRHSDAMGENWKKATDILDQKMGHLFPAFKAASAQWWAEHYQKKKPTSYFSLLFLLRNLLLKSKNFLKKEAQESSIAQIWAQIQEHRAQYEQGNQFKPRNWEHSIAPLTLKQIDYLRTHNFMFEKLILSPFDHVKLMGYLWETHLCSAQRNALLPYTQEEL